MPSFFKYPVCQLSQPKIRRLTDDGEVVDSKQLKNFTVVEDNGIYPTGYSYGLIGHSVTHRASSDKLGI